MLFGLRLPAAGATDSPVKLVTFGGSVGLADHRIAAANTPAVIVGALLNGLGVARSLAAAKVPTIVVDTNLRLAAMWSRGSRRHIVRQMLGRPFVDDLLKLQGKVGAKPVLILTDELAVDTVSEHRAELASAYRLRLPSKTMITALGNKELFYRFAETHGLPVPRTLIIKSESDMKRVRELDLPVIVKPADKLQFHLGQIERVNLVSNVEQADESCGRLLQLGISAVVQEWIDGPDENIYFALFHCGASPKSSSIFFGRKIAIRPPRVGSTAVCVPAPEAAKVLRPITEKFIELSNYEGLGSLEFKWNPQTRRFVIIEPTVGRTDWQEEIATLNGLNLPLIAYRYELGLPLPERRPVHSAAWRESFRSAASCLGLGHRIYDGYWRIDDPLPAVVHGIDLALRAVQQSVQRFKRRDRTSLRTDSRGDAAAYLKEMTVHDEM